MDERERIADLGGTPIKLLGHLPRTGEWIHGRFLVPAARRAVAPLTAATLARGLVIVSTLPNIRRHACITQILDLEEATPHLLPDARVLHVSADEPEYWREVDQFHGNVRAPGYSLHGADPESRVAFTHAFGVAVAGQARIAHGCFALRDGVVLAAEVPHHQMHSMDVLPFLRHVAAVDPMR